MSDIDPNIVDDQEHFSRWVYQPRFIDENGRLNSRFVILRPTINEEGLSGQLFDRISLEVAVSEGKKFIRKYKTNSEKLVALAIVGVGDLRQIADVNDIIDVVSVPSESVSAHAEIRFYLNGQLATGNTPTSFLKYYFDEINSLMQDNLRFI